MGRADVAGEWPLAGTASGGETKAVADGIQHDSLLDRKDLAAGEEDYLEVLGDLIEQYESEAHPIAPVSDMEMLRHLIEAKGVSQTEVSKATGIVDSTISEVLKGKRSLNRHHIGILSRYFGVSPDVFAF